MIIGIVPLRLEVGRAPLLAKIALPLLPESRSVVLKPAFDCNWMRYLMSLHALT